MPVLNKLIVSKANHSAQTKQSFLCTLIYLGGLIFMLNKRLLSLVPNVWQYISKAVFFQWLCLLCSITATTVICFFINNCFIKGQTDLKTYITFVVTIFITASLKAVFTKIQVKTATSLSQNAKTILRERVFTHLAKMGQSYSSLVPTAEAVQVSIEGIDQLESYFGAYLPQLFYAVIAPVTLFAVISFLNLQAAVILLICVPLIPLSIIAVQRLAKKLLNKYWNAYTGLGDSFLENIQGLTTLKIYQADEQRHKQMNIEAENFRKATMRVLVMQLNSISVMDIVAYGGAAGGISAMLWCMQRGTVTLFQGIVIILLSAEFFIPMRQLGSFFHIAMNGASAADKIFKIIDTKLPQKGGETVCNGTKIKMNNVNFAYNADNSVLKNISLTTSDKGLFSLVGKSGCGKSTTAALLTGKLNGFDGEILIGDKNITSLSEKALADNITLINHNSYIFKGTVASNLKMGKPTTTDSEMQNALKTANLTELSLDTPILEQGANLSGGQRQRLALARAILHNTPIYIFDEATSNIDAESEEAIMNSVLELAKTKLVILISHRLANVVKSDEIFVFDNGRITEQGNHNELMNKNGLYAQLYTQQSTFENFGNGRRF
jgi:ABC-type transport system involved in cytochrome bd biosynthesis fused ATPase/permease subunit